MEEMLEIMAHSFFRCSCGGRKKLPEAKSKLQKQGF